MRGRRVSPDEHGNMPLQPGDYGSLEGVWWVRPPSGGTSPILGWRVEEHEGGTITVHGLMRLPNWTGYLKGGVWTDQPHIAPRSSRRQGGPDSS